MDYYIEWECPSCDETNYYGINRTLIEYKGLPVILLGDGDQTTFTCEHCGKNSYTGDTDLFTEDEV